MNGKCESNMITQKILGGGGGGGGGRGYNYSSKTHLSNPCGRII